MNRIIKTGTALLLAILLTTTGAFAVSAADTFSPDNNDMNLSKFKLGAKEFKTTQLLGVQVKSESFNSVRFISVAASEVLNSAEDYGFVFNVVAKNESTADIKNNPEKYINGNTTFVSCKGTENSVAFGKYGNAVFDTAKQGYTRYKYLTAAINNIPDDKYLVSRFYVKNGENTEYSYYKSSGKYCVYDTEGIIDSVRDSIEIIGHRGASDRAPENTLAAFAEAGKQGYDSVEADYWITKNGDILILHNETIKGTNIKDITAETRFNYPIANKFATKELEEEYGQQYIPTMEELVETVSKYNLKLYLHTKDDNTSDDKLKEINGILEKYNMKNRTSIFSKNINTCKRIQTLGVTTGYIISEPSYLTVESAIKSCITNKIDFFVINYIDNFPSDKNISDLHNNGIRIGIYSSPTINANSTLEETMKLINRGIDFSIVNNYI